MRPRGALRGFVDLRLGREGGAGGLGRDSKLSYSLGLDLAGVAGGEKALAGGALGRHTCTPSVRVDRGGGLRRRGPDRG